MEYAAAELTELPIIGLIGTATVWSKASTSPFAKRASFKGDLDSDVTKLILYKIYIRTMVLNSQVDKCHLTTAMVVFVQSRLLEKEQ